MLIPADPNRPYEAHYGDGAVRPVVAIGVDSGTDHFSVFVLDERSGRVVLPASLPGFEGVRPAGV